MQTLTFITPDVNYRNAMRDSNLNRRSVLKALGGTVAVGGVAGAGLVGNSVAATVTFTANDVTISSDTGDVDEVHLNPQSRVEWQNFDVPVTKVRQLIMARIKRGGSVLTPSDPATPQTEAGWWPIYRETPWLFETVGAGTALPVSVDGCGTLSGDGDSVTYEAPAGALSADQSPQNPNHAEVFLSNGGANWQLQIRYATGENQSVPVIDGWSHQENGGQWQAGLPSGYSASINGDTISVTSPGYTHAGASLTTVDGNAGSETCYIAAAGATKPWDSDGLIAVGSPDFSYNGQGANFAQAGYMDSLEVDGFSGQKEAATSGSMEYALKPSSGPNAGSGPIYVAKENEILPSYQQAELTGLSIGQTPAKLNGSYGAVGNADRFDNAADDSTKATAVELGLLTTLHTDYDFAENVAIPSDPNPDRLTPLAMGNSPDVGHAFGQDTHAIPYADLIANADAHPAVDWQTTRFVVRAVNEDSGQQDNDDGTPAGTNANTGGS